MEKNKTHIIALGKGASKAIMSMHRNGYKAKYTIVGNWETAITHHVDIGCVVSWNKDMASLINEVKALISDENTKYFIIVSLGGLIGTTVLNHLFFTMKYILSFFFKVLLLFF